MLVATILAFEDGHVRKRTDFKRRGLRYGEYRQVDVEFEDREDVLVRLWSPDPRYCTYQYSTLTGGIIDGIAAVDITPRE